MKRAVVFVNKYWECDGLMAALLDEDIRDPSLPLPEHINHPRNRKAGLPPMPRATYSIDSWLVEVWCVSDFLEKSDPSLQSSTEEKARVLQPFFQENELDLLIAVGTAGFPNVTTNLNGCVIVGADVFIHDGHPASDPNKLSGWHTGPFDTIIRSAVSADQFDQVTSYDSCALSKSLVKAPNNPCNPFPIAHRSFVSLGTVNVTDYKEYDAKDAETVKTYYAGNKRTPASLETTHGLLRTLGPNEFMFVSGITDHLGSFNTDVTSGQNFAASFNAGVVISSVLVCTSKYLA